MKTAPDFQTGSILLLTATVVCIGLAIAVIAPIIDRPLAGATVTDNAPALEADTKPQAQDLDLSLGEFYPSAGQVKGQLKRSPQASASTIYQASQQTRRSDSANLTALADRRSEGSLKAVATPPNAALSTGVFPTNAPAGSVYAPITIHQPAANASSTGREISDVAERIERLVTERERLAAAVEFEKRRQAAERQQTQIARLEQQLKLLNQSMTNLQSETTMQFSRLTEQNSQIDVASQALDAYREALIIAKKESAESAGRSHLQDDTGRVHIPVLPPMPTHRHNRPAPLDPVERVPQKAEAPLKRLRVSSPVRTFKAPEPETEQTFHPLPTTSKKSNKPSTQNSTKSTDTKSSRSKTSQTHRMNLIPLDAPTIRKFESSELQKWNYKVSSNRHAKDFKKPTKRSPSKQIDVVPDLNVGFEHTYQFESLPIVDDANEVDVTEIVISTIDVDVTDQVTQQYSAQRYSEQHPATEPTTFQFEAIEFPDLSVGNQHEPSVAGQLQDLTLPKRVSKVTPRQILPEQANPKIVKAVSSQRKSNAPPKTAPETQKSWIQRGSGAFNPSRRTTKRQTETAPQSNLGGRGQNRHLQRKPSSQGFLKMPVFSIDRQSKEVSKPASERPSMLQRISHTIQSVGSRSK